MEFDFAVIGGGPAGYVAAIRAAQRGATVALIERDTVGGTCLNRGCIPTKALLASAQVLELLRNAEMFALSAGEVSFDLRAMKKRKDAVVARGVAGIEYLLKRWKIERIQGTGRLSESGSIQVRLNLGGTDTVDAAQVLLATGSEPLTPDGFGYDGRRILTSTEALDLEEVPERVLIVGGSAVGCEFAAWFRAVGADVTLIEMMPRILPAEDAEIARRLGMYLKKRRVTIRAGTRIERIEGEGTDLVAYVRGDDPLRADRVLLAMGRSLNLHGIGLEEAGIRFDRSGIEVDGRMRTSHPNVYAAGDVTGRSLLAHVASTQGLVAAENATQGNREMRYDLVPNCIFTMPEVASVGLSDESARAAGLEIGVGKFPFTANGKASVIGETDGFVKIVAETGTGRLLGVHILGPHATDLIAEAALAMKMGATAADLEDTIHAHPTLSEAVREAAEACAGRAIHIV